jgi:hypothetical protein
MLIDALYASKENIFSYLGNNPTINASAHLATKRELAFFEPPTNSSLIYILET